MINHLTTVALILALIHFGVPLTYYWYAKTKWLKKPWNIKTDENHKPPVTIIIPTYNEASCIEKRLDNIYEQDYPRDKMEIIVIDSASNDDTPEIVKKWSKAHKDINLKLIQEPVRRGKAYALNNALKHATSKIIVIADADAEWERNSLSEAIKWLADPVVGAVSCLKKPKTLGPLSAEESYRQYYNILRVAESKKYATPIFHGELAAFRKELLEQIGGFPTHIGADDSHTATKIALLGYRAIIPETIWCHEPPPPKRREYLQWRIRRAQHLIQHFYKIRKIPRNAPRELKTILRMEKYLHLINPWMLLLAVLLFLLNTFKGSITVIILLLGGMALLVVKPYRTWIIQQAYLIIAVLRNMKTKEIIWTKQSK